MALNRATFAALLGNRAGGYMAAVGLNTTDTSGNLKEPLDDTLRVLGVPFGSEASASLAEGEVSKFLAVGAVYVLRRALAEASGFADVAATTLGTSKRKSQIVKNLQDQLAYAEAQVARFGITEFMVVMGQGVYTTDTIEPEEVA